MYPNNISLLGRKKTRRNTSRTSYKVEVYPVQNIDGNSNGSSVNCFIEKQPFDTILKWKYDS